MTKKITKGIDYQRFSLPNFSRSCVYHGIKILKDNRKSTHLLDEAFIERIMLSVTEVNGCAICSYAHTSMALKQGFNQEEIESFLGGDGTYIVPHEAKALLFAQHYADTRGYIDKEAYDALLEEYGEREREVILSAIKIMMVGNMIGIPMSAFGSRFKGQPYKGSSIFYEIFMMLSSIIFIPVSSIHAIFYKKRLRFASTKE